MVNIDGENWSLKTRFQWDGEIAFRRWKTIESTAFSVDAIGSAVGGKIAEAIPGAVIFIK